MDKKNLKKKSENIANWYTNIILEAKLADYGPAKGTMVIRPYGYSIWENIQKSLDKEIKASGAKNAYFPMFIPLKLFNKEKEHVEGFSPELAVVTIGGGKELAEKLAVRPTSEMLMYEMYAKWIKSYKDLPMVINQWNNVVRWEKRTYLFLRTSEFLWQEGHGAHATHEESLERVYWGINTYEKIYRDFFAIAGVVGKKSAKEKFAGATDTLTFEILIPGGKTLQGCTSHDLGQNFSKALDIGFQDGDGQRKLVWQNSWGFTTRSIGALILEHGDDAGLVLPPKLAPIRAVIIPILGNKDTELLKYCRKLYELLTDKTSDFPGVVEIWDDTDRSFGWKINQAEIMGIPLRIVVGKREMYDKTATLSTRIEAETKILVEMESIFERSEKLLKVMQMQILENSKKLLEESITEVGNWNEFKEIMKNKRGFIKAFWCENQECEESIKAETKASTRCLPLDAADEKGKCIYCGSPALHKWYFGLAY